MTPKKQSPSSIVIPEPTRHALPFGTPLPEPTRDRLRAVVSTRGVVGASTALGVSRPTIERALAGLGLRRGSILVIEQALANQRMK